MPTYYILYFIQKQVGKFMVNLEQDFQDIIQIV